MRNLENLKDILCDELEKIAKEGELTAGSLDTVEKLTHSLKSLTTIMAMEGDSYYGDGYNSYRSYARRGNGGRSNAMRDSRGRYMRYSRDDDIEDKIMDIMQDVDDPKVKQALQKALDKMEG